MEDNYGVFFLRLGGLVAIINFLFRGEWIHFYTHNHTFVHFVLVFSAAGWITSKAMNKTPYCKIMNTIRNLGLSVKIGDKILYPKVAHKYREPYGLHYIFTTPPGISEKDFQKYLRAFEIILNAEVSIYERNGKVHMDILTHELPTKIKYVEVETIAEDTNRNIESRGGMEGLDEIPALPGSRLDGRGQVKLPS